MRGRAQRGVSLQLLLASVLQRHESTGRPLGLDGLVRHVTKAAERADAAGDLHAATPAPRTAHFVRAVVGMVCEDKRSFETVMGGVWRRRAPC